LKRAIGKKKKEATGGKKGSNSYIRKKPGGAENKNRPLTTFERGGERDKGPKTEANKRERRGGCSRK